MKTNSYILANDGRGGYVSEIMADDKGNILNVIDTASLDRAQTYDTEDEAQADAQWLAAAHYNVRIERGPKTR